MKTYQNILVACGLVASLAACGDDKKPATTTDATTASETTAGTDASNPTEVTSTPTDATSPTDTTDPIACDRNGFTAVEQQMTYDPEEGVPRYNAVSATTLPQDVFAMEFFPPVDGSSGDNPLDDGPGTIVIGDKEADENYATCETCVLVRAACDAEDCDKIFYAESGSLAIEEVDYEALEIKGTATNVKLREVTIASDFTSTPVVGGQGWCIDSFAFEAKPECLENEDCTEAGKGICEPTSFTCVACASSFDCAVATPVCTVGADDATVCVAQIDECTGDDASEPNDGPAAATAVTPGTPFDGKSCTGASESELDWFTFTTTGEQNIKAVVSWTTAETQFFVSILNEDGEEVGELGRSTDALDEVIFPFAPAGKYYAIVIPADTASTGGGNTAVSYVLNVTVAAPECTAATAQTACTTVVGRPVCDVDFGQCVACLSSFDCKVALTPACLPDENDQPECTAVAICTGDDAVDADDGPAGATLITVPSTTSAKICGEDGEDSGNESDWYKFVLAASDDVELALSWTGETIDLDFAVFAEDGELIDSGATETDNPETIELNGLDAGTYYVLVLSYAGSGSAASTGYTLTTTLP